MTHTARCYQILISNDNTELMALGFEFEVMYVKTKDGVKKAQKSITIKDLFCMTAGFSYNLNSFQIQKCRQETNGRCTTCELMKYLAKEPLLFEPSKRWEYSLCHDVLAAYFP